MDSVVLSGEGLNILDLAHIAYHPEIKVELAPSARDKMKASRSYIESRIAGGEVMYGVNTGFGAFSSVRISDSEIETLQRNLIRSHSAGIGEPFAREQTRAMMGLRANALARGHSGIRAEVVDKILEFLNKDIIPVVPSQGSVGASGDLAPLSHLALALIGEGEVWGDDGRPADAAGFLAARGVQPLVLKAKEGLSLINGCQVMTAVGSLVALDARRLLKLADIAGAMSLEGLRGSRKAFDPLIAATRPHPGEAKTARNLLRLLGDSSPISKSHEGCGRVQDAYSLRCMPAVHGAAKDSLGYVWKVLETEANSSTDNPLVFADDDKVLSCGNFHGEPVSMAMDFAGMSTAVVASISECRIAKLINPAFSELPAFLAPNGGLNSGLMIVQVAAAALVSENKVLAHPACVDSIPTSTDKEDHVSMGTIAARKFAKILANAEQVVTMEILSAAQALDLLAPHKASAGVQTAFETVRGCVPFAKEDRVFAHDLRELTSDLIQSNKLVNAVEKTVGKLEW